jgi:hypothetical protein
MNAHAFIDQTIRHLDQGEQNGVTGRALARIRRGVHPEAELTEDQQKFILEIFEQIHKEELQDEQRPEMHPLSILAIVNYLNRADLRRTA